MQLTALWWWIDRWRKSTAYTDMTLEEQGAYRNLLDEATLRGGPLPNDERILGKACGDALAWKRIRKAVMARFELKADGWHNKTLDEVIGESKRRAAKQRNYRHSHGNGGGNDDGNGGGNAATTSPVTTNDLLSPGPDPDQSPGQGQTTHSTARLAFAGKRLEVPKFLDEEFVRRLNGRYFDLTAFYLSLDMRLGQTGEPWDLRWIRDQFSAESPSPDRRRVDRDEDRPISAKERSEAERVRRNSWGGRCQHEERCESAAGCIARIVRERRARETAA